jgi:hypothetical protein
MRRLLAGVLVTGVTGLCAGCGSGDETSSTAAAPSSTTAVTTVVPGTTTTTAPATTVTVPPSTPATTATTPATPEIPSAGPERAAYIAKADVVCAEGNAATKKLNVRANKIVRANQKDETALLKALTPVFRDAQKVQGDALKQFKAIPPPPADRAVITQYWATLDQQLELLAQMTDAAAAGDVDAYRQATTKSTALRDQSRALAKAYGYKRCGTDTSDAA